MCVQHAYGAHSVGLDYERACVYLPGRVHVRGGGVNLGSEESNRRMRVKEEGPAKTAGVTRTCTVQHATNMIDRWNVAFGECEFAWDDREASTRTDLTLIVSRVARVNNLVLVLCAPRQIAQQRWMDLFPAQVVCL